MVIRNTNKQWALAEASRCLYCFDAPCSAQCPVGINIPMFIRSILDDDMVTAAKIIKEKNPLGGTCGEVCPDSALCQKVCIRQNLDSPVQIARLQDYACKASPLKKTQNLPAAEKSFKKEKIAVIGLGPAGLSCANDLAAMGYKVCVYEKSNTPGGTARNLIPSYKLRDETFKEDLMGFCLDDVEIVFQKTVGLDVSINEIMDNYSAVFLATGMTHARRMKVEGQNLKGVLDSRNVLSKNSGAKSFSGSTVAVVGGGNVAIDCARTVKKMGASRVMILYRRGKENMPAWEKEVLSAFMEGVEFFFFVIPLKYEGVERLERIRCARTMLKEVKGDTKAQVVTVPETEFSIDVDYVVEAVGYELDKSLMNMFGVETRDGIVVCNPNTYQTANPRVFAGGDLIRGGGYCS